MSSKTIFALFGGALFIGWFLPDAAPVDHKDNAAPKLVAAKAAQPSNESTFTDKDLAFGEDDGTVLQRQGDGHFYADADVDGTGIRFLVDTGASGIALTAQDAQSLGLSWSNDDLEMVGRGVSGAVRGKKVTLQNVELGGTRASNIEAAIIPEGLSVSLLGQSFLSKAESVNISGDKMVLN